MSETEMFNLGGNEFDDVKVHRLTRNMRVEALGAASAAGQELQQFSRWLLEIGEGKTGERVKLPEEMLVDFADEDALIHEVFPNLASGGDSVDACILMPLPQKHV